MTVALTLAAAAISSCWCASVRSRSASAGLSVMRSIPAPVTLARSARTWSSAFCPVLTEAIAWLGALPPNA